MYKCKIEEEGEDGIWYATKLREDLRTKNKEKRLFDDSFNEY